ncbi:MAG: hypothetical protein CBC13_03885 [Planctomycetia bacterium TMED53]|nr:MAG: hypothetical protein CBC13_03885 [Planctomycetia bacterium TMED53]
MLRKIRKGFLFGICFLAVSVGTIEVLEAQVDRYNNRPAAEGDRDIRVGGYLDLELFMNSDRLDFKQHRLVPMLDANISENVSFSAEIEFEYGGASAPRGDGETKVEYAYADVDFGGWTLRSGAILIPLGSTNLYHDSPMRQLTNRPFVARVITPSTMTSAGLGGVWGADDGTWGMEVYAVNGFQGGNAVDGYNFNTSSGIRGGRPSLKTNGGDRPASFVGRFSYSPVLGTEIGLSAWSGPWDDAGDLDLTISMLDITTDLGSWFDVLGATILNFETGSVSIDRDADAIAGGVPDDISATSLEISKKFFPDFVTRLWGEDSSCAFTVRWEEQDLTGPVKSRMTYGFNMRPTDETVLKFDYEQESIDGEEDPDGTFIFSAATYF